MAQTQQLSIVIPVRIDSSERFENLQAIVEFLLHYTESTIIILEADIKRRINTLKESTRVQYTFKEDDDPIFHRTKYINDLLHLAQTPFVGVWDTDVILDPQYIQEALDIMDQGYTICLPYNGKCIFLPEGTSSLVRQCVTSIFESKQIEALKGVSLSRPAVGGAYIVNKAQYLLVGGENEAFYGWGPEDAERIKRLEILGHQIKRTGGCLYHLHHPRGVNSTLGCDIRSAQNLKEFGKICGMKPKALRRYVDNILLRNSTHKKKLIVVGNKDVYSPLVDTFDYVIRINRMTNYGNTGHRTDGLYLEANNIFKRIYTGERLRERINESTHIFMNSNWHRKFEEWTSYLSTHQYALAELIDYEAVCSLVACPNPTSGVALLAHLLSTSWAEEYDIYIIGFELQNRIEMIEKDPYWGWHHGAGAAESAYLTDCINSGKLRELTPEATL